MERRQYYIEDPYQRIVNVHWKHKDEPPDPGDGTDTPPCGGYYNRNGGYDVGIIITEDTIFSLFNPPPPPHTPGRIPSAIPWYLWNTPRGGFTVEIRPEIIYGYGLFAQYPSLPDWLTACNSYSIEIGLHLIRNTDPHTVAQTPLNDYPAGGSLISVEGIKPNESWYPIVLVVGKASDIPLDGTGPCLYMGANVRVPILVQAHCEHMTYGGPPPQDGLPPGLLYAWD